MTEQEHIYYELGYEPDLYPWLYPSLFPGYAAPMFPAFDDNIGSVDPEPDPIVPVPFPEPDTTPAPDPAPPVEVVSVDELLDRLTQGGGETEPALEEPQEPAELLPADPGDTEAVELEPGTLAVMEAMSGFQGELAEISGQLAELQQHLSRPAFTTSFADYTVTETLLLFLLLAVVATACIRMLKGGLKWLRS